MQSQDILNCVAVSISLTLQAALLVDKTALHETIETISIIESSATVKNARERESAAWNKRMLCAF